MRSARCNRTGVWLAASLVFAIQAGTVHASSFSVNPTQVFLSSSAKSALVTIKNQTEQPVRFQIAAMAWDQDDAGRMQMAPTEDIIFFPTLLTLQAREERRVRLGTTLSPGAREKTYRLIVEELPAPQAGNAPTGVAMLTRMTIPVFVEAARPTAQASLSEVGMAGGHLAFRLRNTGSTHFVPQRVRVIGKDETGTTVVDQQVPAWYVLAGGSRVFDLAIGEPECRQVRMLAIDVKVGDASLEETLRTPGGACAK